MRIFDIVILTIGVLGIGFWILVSSKDGFKGSNAMIVARSISIASTIDGQIDNTPPVVGARVTENELLVRIQNDRIDMSRLAGFESQIYYLNNEISNVVEQGVKLATAVKTYEQRAEDYFTWMMKDTELRKTLDSERIHVARMRSELKAKEAVRSTKLFKKRVSSLAVMQTAKTESQVADKQLTLAHTQLQRSELLFGSLKTLGAFFDNGDTSYWAKMVDEFRLRQFDNRNKLFSLQAQLSRARSQAKVERTRVKSSFMEEHRAPFTGMVNAAFVSRDTRVTSGTSLFQILDCAKPIVIIPIPEHRISEFSVGMKVTIYPIDSEQSFAGTIKYVSSGPMIGHDKTIQVQQDLTLSGTRAIVNFDDQELQNNPSQSCDATRKAVAIIHTRSMFDMASQWLSANLPTSVTSATSELAALLK